MRRAEPLVDLAPLRDTGFSVACVYRLVLGVALFGSLYAGDHLTFIVGGDSLIESPSQRFDDVLRELDAFVMAPRAERPLPGRSAGRETTDALALLRSCYVPKASLDRGVALWVTENGYATNLGRSEAGQVADLAPTLRAVHDVSGTLGVTDYRYLNLRDDASMGTDLFAAVGVLRDDYTHRAAFATPHDAIVTNGR